MAFPILLNSPVNKKANVVYPDYPTAYMSFDNHTKILLGNGIVANFYRNSPAYLSNGTLVNTNLPRYEAGQFGNAIMIEEGTTNLVQNGSCENGITNFNAYKGATILTDSSTSWQGTSSIKVVCPGVATQEGILTTATATSCSPNTVYTGSLYIKGTGNVQILLCVLPGGTILAAQNINLNSNWQRVVLTGTTKSDSTSIYMIVWTPTVQAITFWIDGVQIEQKPYATSFIDGTRSPETLTIPTAGVLNPQEGTVERWVYVNNYLKTNYGTTKQIFWWSSGTGRISFGWNVGGQWYAVTGNGTSTATVSISDTLSVGWHLFTMRWNATELALLIDGGAQKATASNPYLPSSVSGSAYIGSGTGGNYTNTLIDDLRISSRARTDAEIAQAYASGQPLYIAS